MATKGPPKVSKVLKGKKTKANSGNNSEVVEDLGSIIAQFITAEGEVTGSPLSLPANATPEQLELLINQLLNNVNKHIDTFFDIFIILNIKLNYNLSCLINFHRTNIYRMRFRLMEGRLHQHFIKILYKNLRDQQKMS